MRPRAGNRRGLGSLPPARALSSSSRSRTDPCSEPSSSSPILNGRDAYLLGGYAGAIFDGRLFIGGAGYWQVNSPGDDYFGYHNLNGYGGLVLEWYAWRSPVVSVSARGLVGGGVANIGWEDYYVPDYPRGPQPRHGGGYPPRGGYYYSTFDQGYFVFEPQVNLSVRIVPGLAVVGGAGYRVIGWANGWEDQLQGFTATVAIRFGSK